MIPRLLATMLAAAFLAGCGEGGTQTCTVGRVVDLPLVADTPLPAIEASMGGQKLLVYIDTGTFVSLITRKAADRLDLRPGPESGFIRISGVGGTVNAPLVKMPNLGLGQGIARNLELPVAGDLGGPVHGVPVLGLFGGDFLANYDVDLDLPGHHFALYQLRGCGSDIRPLKAPFFEVPFRVEDTKISIDLKLNGRPVRGVLDSGASHTTVPLEMARSAGVGDLDMATDTGGRTRGIDGNIVAIKAHRFASLEIGDETLNNFRFGVADVTFNDLILGDDFLRHNEVWISYPQQKLFIRPMAGEAVHWTK